MKLKRVLSVSIDGMKPEVLFSEARARIIWGEPLSSVRDFLTSNGIAAIDAEEQISRFSAERNSEIRQIGIKNTCLGAALTVGAVLFFYLSFKYPEFPRMNSRSARGFATLALGIAIGGFYGLWKLIDGIGCLVRPESEARSISDVTE